MPWTWSWIVKLQINISYNPKFHIYIFKMCLKLMKDLHTLIYKGHVNLKRIGLLYANLELVSTLLKLRRAGTIIFHVKIVFAYHAKLVK